MSKPVATSDSQHLAAKRQRARSIAIAVSLAVLVSLFYAATIVRMSSSGVLKSTAELSHK